ncbi:MAG: PadR family transcriptional regulator [Acholeplasmataceae bacterium]|jgi:PadR family transcriptional regulator PadR|nr:PadR family transcriptional regulator [Acholeplasmataceae bacterium]MDY0339134.1 PadR family transcriptional regulator [Acholeplasmataceae bacterium]
MKQQVKKGILEIFVLAVLSKGESYGYQIINDLSDTIVITESTLYPILRRLLNQGELESYNEIFQGRNRKYYKITKKGKIHLDEFMEEWETIRKIYEILRK